MDNDKLGFWLVMWLVFVAEIPCIVRTVALQAGNKSIWSVACGTLAGSVLALFVGIVFAKMAGNFLGDRYMHCFENVMGLVLIGLGIYMLLRPDHAH